MIKLKGVIQKADTSKITDEEKLDLMEKFIGLIEKEGFETVLYTKLVDKEEASEFVKEIEGKSEKTNKLEEENANLQKCLASNLQIQTEMVKSAEKLEAKLRKQIEELEWQLNNLDIGE